METAAPGNGPALPLPTPPETPHHISATVVLDAIEAKEWKRENGQKWDCKKTLTDNLIQREGYAWENAQRWMTNCFGLNLETLWAIAAGGDVQSLILEIGDYEGPAALLRDTADWLAERRTWRKAFRPVLDAVGYK